MVGGIGMLIGAPGAGCDGIGMLIWPLEVGLDAAGIGMVIDGEGRLGPALCTGWTALRLGFAALTVFFRAGFFAGGFALCARIAMPGMFIGIDWPSSGPAAQRSDATAVEKISRAFTCHQLRRPPSTRPCRS